MVYDSLHSGAEPLSDHSSHWGRNHTKLIEMTVPLGKGVAKLAALPKIVVIILRNNYFRVRPVIRLSIGADAE